MKEKLVVLLAFVLMVGFMLLLHRYQNKKEQEYGNDERWQAVKNRMERVMLWYYQAVAALLIIGMVGVLFFNVALHIEVYDLFGHAVDIMVLRSIVGYGVLRYYDQAI